MSLLQDEVVNWHCLRIAGGETTSTFLAGTTYFLLKNPSTMRKLTSEIRMAFPSYGSINAQEAQRLPYLQAVINEGLRIYPPASQGAPRTSTGFELHSRYIPAGVSISFRYHWSLERSSR